MLKYAGSSDLVRHEMTSDWSTHNPSPTIDAMRPYVSAALALATTLVVNACGSPASSAGQTQDPTPTGGPPATSQDNAPQASTQARTIGLDRDNWAVWLNSENLTYTDRTLWARGPVGASLSTGTEAFSENLPEGPERSVLRGDARFTNEGDTRLQLVDEDHYGETQFPSIQAAGRTVYAGKTNSTDKVPSGITFPIDPDKDVSIAVAANRETTIVCVDGEGTQFPTSPSWQTPDVQLVSTQPGGEIVIEDPRLTLRDTSLTFTPDAPGSSHGVCTDTFGR